MPEEVTISHVGFTRTRVVDVDIDGPDTSVDILDFRGLDPPLPHGEDSWGLWQVNLPPSHPTDPPAAWVSDDVSELPAELSVAVSPPVTDLVL